MIDKKLLTLLSISETGNYAKTAKDLGVTQPGVFQHIRSLEKELGITIFKKEKGQLVPTKQGRIAIEYAKKIKSIYSKQDKDIYDAGINAFSLRVSLLREQANQKVQESLTLLANRINGLTINVSLDNLNNIYNDLDSYEIDLAIIETNNVNSRFNYLLLDTDTLVLAVPQNSLYAAKNIISLNELKQMNLILQGRDSSSSILFDSSLKEKNMKLSDFHVSLEIDDVETIKTLVRKGAGVSILPKRLCRTKPGEEPLILLPIAGLPLIKETKIIYCKDFERTDLLEELVKSYQSIEDD